ncbi:MAG: SDR family oxidoreductase [Minicystis sp.]
MARFTDKVVVVTGGSDGIGLATAKAFAAEGARVFVTGRRQERLDEAVKEIGGHTVGVQGDVANLADLDRLYARIARDHDHIDVVFANAGISETVPFGEVDEAHFDRVFGANVRGLLFSVQKALPRMRPGSSIILNGSGVGSKGFAGLSVYSATKAAVRNFARTWTSDFKGRGIRVNVVSPGMVDTPAMQTFLAANTGMEDALKQMIPLGGLGKSEDVANAVLFLAAPESHYIAGIELFVDGGVVAV